MRPEFKSKMFALKLMFEFNTGNLGNLSTWLPNTERRIPDSPEDTRQGSLDRTQHLEQRFNTYSTELTLFIGLSLQHVRLWLCAIEDRLCVRGITCVVSCKVEL